AAPFVAAARSRRVESVRITRVRSGWLGGAAFIGAVAVAVLAVVVAVNTLRPSSDHVATVPSASPTPTATATVTPTSTASPSPTPAGLYTTEPYTLSAALPPPARQPTLVLNGT